MFNFLKPIEFYKTKWQNLKIIRKLIMPKTLIFYFLTL